MSNDTFRRAHDDTGQLIYEAQCMLAATYALHDSAVWPDGNPAVVNQTYTMLSVLEAKLGQIEEAHDVEWKEAWAK